MNSNVSLCLADTTAQAIEEKQKKTQEALVRKQKRSAAMEAMLAKPGYSGVSLDSPIDITQEVPAWVMDGGIRCILWDRSAPSNACCASLAATCSVVMGTASNVSSVQTCAVFPEGCSASVE